jgi:hypothetical protein
MTDIFSNPLRRSLRGSGLSVPAIRGAATITDVTWTDSTDNAEFTASKPCFIYWATSNTGDSPDQKDILHGTGGCLEYGVFEAPQSGIFRVPYTSASGNHNDVKKLSYFVEPTSYAWTQSTVQNHSITLNLVPAPFAFGMWALENEGNGTSVLLDIVSLPDDNGSPIDLVEYRINGGSWVDLGDYVADMYEITGFTPGALYSFELQASNANGPSTISDVKYIEPLATDWTEFTYELWTSKDGITIASSQVQIWEGTQQGIFLDKNVDGITFNATGSPNSSPCVTFANGASMISNMTGIDFPLGSDDRTLFALVRLTDAWANYPSMPFYGTAETNKGFGLTVSSSEFPHFDYWGGGFSGSTSMADNAWRVIMVSLRKNVARLFVSKEIESALVMDQEVEQQGVTLDTAEGTMRLGRALNNASRSPFEICAFGMLDHALSATHRAQVLAYLETEFLV